MPNEDELRFGYERQMGSGMWIQTGREGGYLLDRGGGMFPVTIGAFDYVIAGHKGHIVNWMIDHGDQIVKADQNLRRGATVQFVLRDAASSIADMARNFLFSFGLSAMRPGPVKDVLGKVKKLPGQIVAGRNFVQGDSEGPTEAALALWNLRSDVAEALGGARPLQEGARAAERHRFPTLTAKKVLRLTDVVSSADKKYALKIMDSNTERVNFSSIAAWMFGS